ncbi:MAB_1171c family putative transporter [Streptomyces sp. UH6]|uniref:MAB_1171c family putative transporter n=1 Tax=Streptomyces sp. UH6 TaxID=2748379 RepID=UPI0027D2E39B|nr:MAB_1171c family putative transporter [Streptomyces sp. UH6]
MIVVTLLWITVAWRALKVWRRGQDRTLWWAFLGLAVMMTLRLPAGKALDEALGIVDFSYLLKHLFGGILASGALLAFLRKVSGSPDGPWARRRRIAFSSATALVMSVLFFAELQPYETPVIFADTVASYAFVVYTLLFLGYLTASLLEGMRVCWRWGGNSSGRVLGWGLRVVGVGLAAGVLYAVMRAATVTTRVHGNGVFPGAIDDYLCTAFLLAALVLIVVGTTMPALDALNLWRRKRAALLGLRPLWLDLTEAIPSVRLHATRRALAERLDPRDVHPRLYRRGIEIRDAALSLSGYATVDVLDRAELHVEERGLFGTQAAVAVEACWLAAARQAKLSGAKLDNTTEHQPAGGGRDLRTEIAALTQLSEAYYSPLVRDFLGADHRTMEKQA